MESEIGPIRALELYSGIGGFHYALNGIETLQSEVCAAVDINTSANETYKYNFPDTEILQRNIESFTADEIDKLDANLIWMSPPCQPFTRLGKQKDCDDKRNDSFLHFISLIPNLRKKPTCIMLENVKGFEDSVTRARFIKMLQQTGYNYQEFLLTPQMFGIPNSRLRYYIIAKLKPMKFCFQTSPKVMTKFLHLTSNLLSLDRLAVAELDTSQSETLTDYFEDSPTDAYFDDYLLPDKVLLKYANILDIVDKDSKNSCCFTKGYNHYVEGTGSVIHGNLEVTVSDVYGAIERLTNKDETTTVLKLLQTLQLRYFTPREIANLMHFPPDFGFPENVTSRQKYRLLGNSLNVCVVKNLLRLCVFPTQK